MAVERAPITRETARGSQVSESVFWCTSHNITPFCRLMAAKEEDEEGGEEQEPHTQEQTGNRLQVSNLIITSKRCSQLNNSRRERSIGGCFDLQ